MKKQDRAASLHRPAGSGNHTTSSTVPYPMTRRTVLVFIFAMTASAMATGEVSGSVPTCGRAQRQLETMNGALEMRATLNGELPDDSEWFDVLVRERLVHASFRMDPWGRPYVYRRTGTTFELMTVGADGQAGTDDDQIKADRWKWRSCSKGCLPSGCISP